LGREVNKIETEMNESFYLSSDNYNYYSKNDDKGKVKLHLDSLRNFALKLYRDKKYVQPQLGLITAYLSWMNKENTLAKNTFPK
jgi:hypothetical protein